MPTRYRRIGVVLDPELSDALAAARGRVRASSSAEALRKLALIGARALEAEDGGLEQARRELDQMGAARERGDLVVISRRLRHRPRRVESAGESLEWARGER